MRFHDEHLLPGQIGHFFLLLSLVCSLGATVAYFLSVRSKDLNDSLGWKKLARIFFLTEVISVFAVFGLLFLHYQ